MLEIVQLFKDEGTVDELGIGAIRDTIANALFPGTSVLHTRLRYVLFIPWLLQRSAREPDAEQMSKAMRKHEISLIRALLKGEQSGVIGQQAKEKLKRMPSEAYWAQLATWGLRAPSDGGQVSLAGFFRHAHAVRSLNGRAVASDDLEAREDRHRLLLDPEIPSAPDGLLDSATFDLTGDEEDYLSMKIATSTEGSLLGWLVSNPPSRRVRWVWDLPRAESDEFPPRSRRLIEHGWRFHSAVHGAALLYNLLLSEKAEREDGIDGYRLRLAEWRREVEDEQTLAGLDRTNLWLTLDAENPRLSHLTRRFIDGWLDILVETTDVADHPGARRLIEAREQQIKGAARAWSTVRRWMPGAERADSGA